MTSTSARKFRIEGGGYGARLPHIIQPSMHSDTPFDGSLSSPPPALDAVLSELRALRAAIEGMGAGSPEVMSSAADVRSGIAEIDEAIRGTKKELAAIKVGDSIGGVDIAALELNTVVAQTEAATIDILSAGEAIETLAGSIQSETTLEAAKALATDIAEKVTIIYMACNFQDLSGQRVSRVVDTLNFIETRVHRMIEAWGGLHELHDLIEEEIRTKDEERATEGAAALLTGPVPVNADDHVDQSAIDALFD